MNSPFILEQADIFAEQLQQNFDSPNGRIKSAFLKAYGRPATTDEMQSTIRFYQRFVPAAIKEAGDHQQAERMFLSAVCQGLLCSAEFRFLN